MSSSWESPVKGMRAMVACEEAFLFSIVPFGGVTQFPLKSGKQRRAMQCSRECGPSFGDRDLEVGSEGGARGIFDRRSSCRVGQGQHSTYGALGKAPPIFTGSTHFTPSDMEVFAVFYDSEIPVPVPPPVLDNEAIVRPLLGSST